MRASTARGESLASHRDGRGAPMARRDDREYREYLSEEQRSQRGPQCGSRVGVERGCIARRMQPDFRHGLLSRLSDACLCAMVATAVQSMSAFEHTDAAFTADTPPLRPTEPTL